MFSVEQDFQLRLAETKGIISLIEDIESGVVNSPNRINIPVLRSTVVVSLYNVIESTITQTLTKFHDEINSNRVLYDDLSDEIKNLALIYFYKHKAKRSDINGSIDVIHHTVDLIRGVGFFNVPYKEMIESYQLYNGNLDAKEIRRVMKKYGIIISEEHGMELKKIKNGRNTLSHGNKSFEEYGRDLVLPMLKNYILDVERLLDNVIGEGKKFLDNKLYRTTSR